MDRGLSITAKHDVLQSYVEPSDSPPYTKCPAVNADSIARLEVASDGASRVRRVLGDVTNTMSQGSAHNASKAGRKAVLNASPVRGGPGSIKSSATLNTGKSGGSESLRSTLARFKEFNRPRSNSPRLSVLGATPQGKSGGGRGSDLPSPLPLKSVAGQSPLREAAEVEIARLRTKMREMEAVATTEQRRCQSFGELLSKANAELAMARRQAEDMGSAMSGGEDVIVFPAVGSDGVPPPLPSGSSTSGSARVLEGELSAAAQRNNELEGEISRLRGINSRLEKALRGGMSERHSSSHEGQDHECRLKNCEKCREELREKEVERLRTVEGAMVDKEITITQLSDTVEQLKRQLMEMEARAAQVPPAVDTSMVSESVNAPDCKAAVPTGQEDPAITKGTDGDHDVTLPLEDGLSNDDIITDSAELPPETAGVDVSDMNVEEDGFIRGAGNAEMTGYATPDARPVQAWRTEDSVARTSMYHTPARASVVITPKYNPSEVIASQRKGKTTPGTTCDKGELPDYFESVKEPVTPYIGHQSPRRNPNQFSHNSIKGERRVPTETKETKEPKQTRQPACTLTLLTIEKPGRGPVRRKKQEGNGAAANAASIVVGRDLSLASDAPAPGWGGWLMSAVCGVATRGKSKK